MSRQRSSKSLRLSQSANDLKKIVKVCPVCERAFHNRRKWEARGLWESIVYCSERCRRASKK